MDLSDSSSFDPDSRRQSLVVRNLEQQQQLEKLSREYDEFLYIISHDFSAPLRQIDQFGQLLEERLGDRLDEEEKLFLTFIREATDRTQLMLNGLLQLSRIKVNEELRIECDCSTIVQEVVNKLEQEFPDREVNISYSDLPVVKADHKQITELFYQLLRNTIVYGKKEAAVVVSIEASRCADQWEFLVKDNGIGIKPEQGENIFSAFRKLHGKDEYPGLGLGLTLCKKIVQCHGGSIELLNSSTEGSTFTFSLLSEIVLSH